MFQAPRTAAQTPVGSSHVSFLGSDSLCSCDIASLSTRSTAQRILPTMSDTTASRGRRLLALTQSVFIDCIARAFCCCAGSRVLILRCWLIRRRLVRALEAASSAREAARRFEVSASAAIKLIRRVRATGGTAPARVGGYRRPLLDGHEMLLRELTSARPGITLAEIKSALAQRGVEAGHPTTIWHTLRRLGLSHKKALPFGRAGPAGRSAWSRPLAHVAALHGSGALRVSR